jgi:hypothetical protein
MDLGLSMHDHAARLQTRTLLRKLSRERADNKVHCIICGDTSAECALKRTKLGILCVECIEHQNRLA